VINDRDVEMHKYVVVWRSSKVTATLRSVFDCQGPCMNTDTACSSSLVATHFGHKGLKSQETVAAVCGGLNVMLLPSTTYIICTLGALSPVARCKTFDATADG
jgi:acyl transferase domain-containing protein